LRKGYELDYAYSKINKIIRDEAQQEKMHSKIWEYYDKL
jgi:hypothetical protein